MRATNIDPDALFALGQALQQAGYTFTTITPASHRRVNARPENACARDLRGVFGWSRPFQPGLLPAPLLALMQRAGVLAQASEQPGLLRASVRASSVGAHLVFHSAFPTRDDDAVFFGPDTYRFIAAFEREAASLAPPRRALDIGCGSGAGALAVAARYRQAAVLATDINPRALLLAGVNARLAGAVNVETGYSDLLQGVTGQFDLVLSNPPYILDPARLRYRHGGAMHGAGLSLQIVEQSLPRLAAAGTLLLYTGVAMVDGRDAFLEAITPLLAAHCANWDYTELDPDIFGGQLDSEGYEEVERIAAVWLRATKRG